MEPLRILSTLAVQGVIQQARTRLEDAAGLPLAFEFAPTADLLARIARGETADVAILTRGAIDGLIEQGRFAPGSRADVAVSCIGAAVKAGEPHPAISTVDAFRSALLGARSLAYSRTGISGIYIAGLLERMALAQAVNARAHVLDGGLTATLLVDGRCDLAIQQVSELLAVPGIEVIGHLPEGVQSATVFAAGRFALSKFPVAADRLIRCLVAPELRPVFEARGLQAPAP